MDLEIVTHCWSGNEVPVYHKLLKLQLNSILSLHNKRDRNPTFTNTQGPLPSVQVTVFFTPQDIKTSQVIADALIAAEGRTQVKICPRPLVPECLYRRAIGRNMAALETQASVVWFTDCDHLFTPPTIRAAVKESLAASSAMIHPRHVHINRTHDLGDSLLERADDWAWGNFMPPSGDFYPRREKRAIGGLQIVNGEWARNGYLNDTKWVEPVKAEHFLQCSCDVPYRRYCGGSSGKDIPGLFRVRHTRAGRDRGEKDHGGQTR